MRVVLAYSGGLDTSIILKWLIEEYDAEVIAYTADVGQGVVVQQDLVIIVGALVGGAALKADDFVFLVQFGHWMTIDIHEFLYFKSMAALEFIY